MEIWKDVIGYEGLYQVSNLGNVKSLSKVKVSSNKKGKYLFTTKDIILKPGNDGAGYLRVCLTKDSKRMTKKVHRLVAESFIGLESIQVVNHIDFNRSNNNVTNLECCSILENNRHSRINNRYPKLIMSDNHKKIILDTNSKKVMCTLSCKIYDSAKIAAIELGYKRSTLIHYLLGTRKNKTTLIYI
jgi:hypothetical protein